MRLLVVEDYEPLRSSLVRALKNAGYAVDETGDGEEAIWYLDNNPYDLAILDIMLPQRDGYSIIKHVRNQDAETALLVLSAKDTTEDQVNGLDLGADDYMCKPFAIDELMARIRSLLRRRHAKRSPVLRWHNLSFDSNTRKTTVDDQVIDLSAREATLLEYLFNHQGALITRNDLWEHLYDFNAEVTSNVVDQWVARIRRKITQAGCGDPIETVRGQGYRFKDEQES